MKRLLLLAALASAALAGEPGLRLHGTGNSMRPLFANDEWIVVDASVPFAALHAGMPVVRHMQGEFFPVCHLLVCKVGNGWRTQGVNNDYADLWLMREADYLGVARKQNPASK